MYLMTLSENAEKVLELLQKGSVTKEEIAEQLKLSKNTITRIFTELKKTGHTVTKKDKGEKNSQYFLPVSIDNIVENFGLNDLPSPTYQEPLEIKTKDPEGFKLAFANTIYAGGKTNQNLVKNLLKYCQADGVDGLVITGNTVWMDLTKFSKYKPDRAQSSEFVPNPSDIDYSDYIKSQGKGPKDLLAAKKPVFVTFKERFDMILNNSLAPLFLDETKQPIYKGPVYVIFGQIEEELARQHANDLVRKETFKAKEEVKLQIDSLRGEIHDYKKTKKELWGKLEDAKGEDKKNLDSKIKGIDKKVDEISSNILELKDHATRLTMTNVDEQFVTLAFLAMKKYIKDKIEESIPNCKVISTGDGFIKAGGEIIKLVYTADKLSKKVSDTLMDKLVEKTRENLPLGEKPYMIVAGGLSSVYAQVPVAYVSMDKKEEQTKTITLIQLPSCLDDSTLIDLIKNKVRASGNDMTQLATKNDFHSGALIVEKTSGLQKRKLLTTHYLSNNDAFKDPAKITDYKMFYGANFADQHHGSKYVSIIETKDNILYAFDVAQKFLQEIGAPIVRITSLGDEIQAKNYDTSAEGHTENLLPTNLEDKIKEIYDLSVADPQKLASDIKKLAMKTKVRAGIDMPKDQEEDFFKIINYEYMKQVLENYRSIGMSGPMMQIIEGNHSMHTFEGLFVPSEDLAKDISAKIGAKQGEVIAPIFGQMGLHIGSFGVKDHYQYGEYSRHKQGGAKNVRDPTRSTRTSFTKRGQDFPDLIDRFTVNRAGHTHMGGQTASRNVFHDIAYCFMDRNGYGEQYNFGSPARGFKMEGQPIDGWAYGPIITIEVPIEYLAKWANEKPKIDVEKLFENSIIKPKK